ncbi:ATP-binding protein [Deltaproteobacteria bacterium TL4]
MSQRLPWFLKVRRNFSAFIESDPRNRSRILASVLLLFLIFFLLYFDFQHGMANWSSVSSSQLSVFVAINVQIILLVLVFYVLLRNLLKLAFERNQHVIGVNLKTKLIIAFLFLALPATVFHLFASSFISSTLETWLAGQHETVVYNARTVSEAYQRNLKSILRLQSWTVENNLKQQPDLLKDPEAMKQLFTEEVGEGIIIYQHNHEVLFLLLQTNKAQQHWKPLTKSEWNQIDNTPSVWLRKEAPERFLYRFLKNIKIERQPYVLEICLPENRVLTGAVNEIVQQEYDTRIFSESEDLVKRYYIVIFMFMTLSIVFVATWLAFYLARGFVRPIERLALATKRVAEGELGYQVPTEQMHLDKDFALLVESFNSMSRQLLEKQVVLDKTTEYLQNSHRTLEEHTRFIELVLENIKTGVISLDLEGRVNSLNRAAKNLLQLKTSNYSGMHYADVLAEESLDIFEVLFQKICKTQGRFISQNITIAKQNRPTLIVITMLMLRNRKGDSVGMIAVYENVTELQRLQRAQAWREVARRIAHEIKNPLTPIQLSAERIRRKYAQLVHEEPAFDQATTTIIREVEQLKRMVSEFSNFARLPECNPQPENLIAVIKEVAQLYQNALPSKVKLTLELDENMPRLSLDREQIKRVFINLVDNASSAVGKEGLITIRTQYNEELKLARIDVIDSGPGVSPVILDRLFEPYATTKKQGTGLGLTIVSQIILDHNGYVRHKTPENGGACFTIELPASLMS